MTGRVKKKMFLEPAKIVTVDTVEGLICTHEVHTRLHNVCVCVLITASDYSAVYILYMYSGESCTCIYMCMFYFSILSGCSSTWYGI